MDFSTLAIYNPWRRSDKSDEALCDSLLKRLNDKAFKREYAGRLDMSGNGVFVVRGMRQIGKSTLMKTENASLIRQNQRRTVLYLPLDTITSFEQLRELLLQYLQFTEAERKRYIFIDEITMVGQWRRTIKEVRDNTAMGEDVFVLSGSSAWDRKKDSERLPGRKGDSQSDHVLLPVTFREFLTQRIPNLPPKKEFAGNPQINGARSDGMVAFWRKNTRRMGRIPSDRRHPFGHRIAFDRKKHALTCKRFLGYPHW
jgi:predicted AAA+ superfamily ATPase